MALIHLATMCVVLWGFLPLPAWLCLLHCCNQAEIDQTFSLLEDNTNFPVMKASAKCQAVSSGHPRQRSISPWGYKKDSNESRFPRHLWQANCSCQNCLSLDDRDSQNIHTAKKMNGNSVAVSYQTLVFYKKECEEPNLYRLVPESYRVDVSCTCVVPYRHGSTSSQRANHR